MKSCLQEYQGLDVKEIAEKYIEGQPSVGETPVYPDETNAASQIHGVSGEDTSLYEGTVTYDIRFHAIAPVSGELIRLIINVEAQNVFNPGYPLLKRGIYYCSRMISAPSTAPSSLRPSTAPSSLRPSTIRSRRFIPSGSV